MYINKDLRVDRERVLAQADLEEHAIRDADRAALRAPVEHHAALAAPVELREADALDFLRPRDVEVRGPVCVPFSVPDL